MVGHGVEIALNAVGIFQAAKFAEFSRSEGVRFEHLLWGSVTVGKVVDPSRLSAVEGSSSPRQAFCFTMLRRFGAGGSGSGWRLACAVQDFLQHGGVVAILPFLRKQQ